MILKYLKERWQLWRIRPGMIFAAKIAEQEAWKHESSRLLGPELNLLVLSVSLRNRAADSYNGDLRGMILDATTPIMRHNHKANAELADCMWQLLDDMGTDGQCVCLLAKAEARIAVEPFLTEDRPAGLNWMPLEDARRIVDEAG